MVVDIQEMKDKLLALRLYVENNQDDDEGDSWYYLHNPNIVKHLNSFNEEECQRLKAELFHWEELIYADLADPFLDIENDFLDGYEMYIRIVYELDNQEKLDYLIQNFQIISVVDKGGLPISFYEELKKKLIAKGYTPVIIDMIDQKIQQEMH